MEGIKQDTAYFGLSFSIADWALFYRSVCKASGDLSIFRCPPGSPHLQTHSQLHFSSGWLVAKTPAWETMCYPMKQSQMNSTPGIQYWIWIHSILMQEDELGNPEGPLSSRFFSVIKIIFPKKSMQRYSSFGPKTC